MEQLEEKQPFDVIVIGAGAAGMMAAGTAARSGKRVLLIDLDLRRHALSSQLGHSNSKTGITSYLAGTVSDVESMIQNSGFHQNLDVIYAGVQPPNPAEMLLSDTTSVIKLCL